jgi:Cu/Ag efflux protein CusF
MKLYYLIPALGFAALLTACGKKAETESAAPANAMNAASSAMENMPHMSNMAMPAARMAKGVGTVKAIDRTAGTITLEHGPIVEAKWPAMTMAFKAARPLLDSVTVGDKVTFDLKLEGDSGEVTAVAAQ